MSIGHFSKASGMIVWFVYAIVSRVISHASSQSILSSSTRMRMSSATATAGCVSLMWMAIFFAKSLMSMPASR